MIIDTRYIFGQFLSPKEACVFIFLLNYANQEGEFRTSSREVADALGLSESIIRRILEKFEQSKFISRVRCQNGFVGTITNIDSYVARCQNKSKDNLLGEEETEKQKTKKTTKRQSAYAKKKTPEDIERRKNEFWQTLVPWINDYGQELIERFYIYWGESDPKTGALRYETQPSWEVGGRLATFGKNQRNWGSSFGNQTTDQNKPNEEADKYTAFINYISNNGLGRFARFFDQTAFGNIKAKYDSHKILAILNYLNSINWDDTDIEYAFECYEGFA